MAGHQARNHRLLGLLRQITHGNRRAHRRQRGPHFVGRAPVDMTTADGASAPSRLEFEIDAGERAAQLGPPDVQDAAMCDLASFQYLLLEP